MIGDKDAKAPATHERVSTGVRELDQILHGGFPCNSINIVMGHPGTGKTILAEQMVFHNANGGRPILYLSTLSEPLSKIVTYLQGFSFYDEEHMMGGVVYEDIGHVLVEHGSQALVDRVREAVREIGPKMIIVDSFKAIHDLTEMTQMRRMISELAGVLSAYDTTVFLIGEYTEDQVPRYPEFAVADGIIELARRSTDKRDDRFLRVLKLRGSGYAEGFHAFTISADGLNVYPRLVTPVAPGGYEGVRDRITSGVAGLDELLDGGLWRGSSVLVTGQAGAGKTTMALQFVMEAARQNEGALYLNFQENPRQLARSVLALGHSPDELAEQGLLFRYHSPVELSIDSVVLQVLEAVRETGVRRVAIDALGDLALAAGDPRRFHDYLYSLTQELIVQGVTSMFTLEISPDPSVPHQRESARFSSMSDTLIDLDILMEGGPIRTCRVVKARGIAHDMRVHEMRIEGDGIVIGEPLDLV